MAKPKQPINPFYVLSAVLGVLFTLTACGYGVLMLRTNRGMAQATEPHPFLNLLDRHGMAILGVEVVLVAVFAVAAIWLDHYRGQNSNSQAPNPKQIPNPKS